MIKLYTIGEFAGLFNISTDTLRFYDKVGLLKPWQISESGYRYYCDAQFDIVSTIILFRAAGIPIPRLREIIHSNDSSIILEELKTTQSQLQSKIKELENVSKRITQIEQNIRETEKPHSVSFLKLPAFWILSQDLNLKDEKIDFSNIKSNLSTIDSDWLSFANVMSTISPENLARGLYHDYSQYGYISEIPYPGKNSRIRKYKPGIYACTTAKAETAELLELDQVYDNLLSAIKQEGYEVTGPAIERNILDLVKSPPHQYRHFFKIYIPVKK